MVNKINMKSQLKHKGDKSKRPPIHLSFWGGQRFCVYCMAFCPTVSFQEMCVVSNTLVRIIHQA